MTCVMCAQDVCPRGSAAGGQGTRPLSSEQVGGDLGDFSARMSSIPQALGSPCSVPGTVPGPGDAAQTLPS